MYSIRRAERWAFWIKGEKRQKEKRRVLSGIYSIEMGGTQNG
jgi:hypothetical protein